MEYKFKKLFGKKTATFFLILSLVSSTLYLPTFTPRAQAVLGISDFGFDLEDVVKFVLDGIAVPIAKSMVDEIVKSTVEWANTGFEGGPAYITDTGKYFEETADGIAGEFIAGSDLGFLCSPFQREIRLSLQRNFFQPAEKRFQCTLSGIKGNAEEFFEGNFNRGGGWDTWFAVTQNPVNNPYGAYIEASAELNNQVAAKLSIAKAEQQINQGFKSLTSCEAKNPSQDALDVLEKIQGDLSLISELRGAADEARDVIQNKKPYDLTKPGDSCIKGGPVQTAGATIKAQLDNVLPSGLQQLINADQMSELVGAFASGILQRYVFGSKGLFASDTVNSGNREMLDVDEDGIPDGFSYDGTNLSICHHGLKPRPENVAVEDWKPGNETCNLSRTVGSSPYFAPICENLGKSIRAVEKYSDFIGRNIFKEEQANTWMRNTTVVSGTIDELSTTLSRLESAEYDPVLFFLGKYEKRLDETIESLAKNGDLKTKKGITRAVGIGDNDEKKRGEIIKDTRSILQYLKKFQTEVVSNRCANPDVEKIDKIPSPEFVPEEPEEPDNKSIDQGVEKNPRDKTPL